MDSVPSYFFNKDRSYIYNHPIISKEGRTYEKREFKKNFPNEPYYDNLELRTNIQDFLAENTKFHGLVYKSDKSGIERIIEILEKKKKFDNLRKAQSFCLQDINEANYQGQSLTCALLNLHLDMFKYIIMNVEDDFDDNGALLLSKCIEMDKKNYFDFVTNYFSDVPYGFQFRDKNLINYAIERGDKYSNFFISSIKKEDDYKFINISSVIKTGNSKLLKFLVNKPINIVVNNDSVGPIYNPLFEAFTYHNFSNKIIKIIYKKWPHFFSAPEVKSNSKGFFERNLFRKKFEHILELLSIFKFDKTALLGQFSVTTYEKYRDFDKITDFVLKNKIDGPTPWVKDLNLNEVKILVQKIDFKSRPYPSSSLTTQQTKSLYEIVQTFSSM